MFKRFVNFFRALFPFLFASQLSPLYRAPAGYRLSLDDLKGMFPHLAYGGAHSFRVPYRSNGASRRRKSNRLRISKMTRNKHR
ncbi:MAG TPA: hypothetical protein VF599_12375 [Pyrinomonadaceae bacterium]|jgi:hypothetical protein